MSSDLLKKPLPYIALLIAHIIWGGNYVAAKITLHEFPPMTLAFLRFGLACLLIIPFLSTIDPKKKRIKIEHLPKLVLGSLFIVVINIAFFYQGISRTTAIDASVLDLSIPIISITLAWWFFKEKIFSINLMGILMGFFGGLVVMGLPLLLTGNFSNKQLLGDGLILMSSLSYVIGSMIFKKVLKNYEPVVVTAFAFLIGAITFFVPAVLEYLNNPAWVSQVSIIGILGLMYIILLSSVSAYFLLLWGISKLDVVHANLFQYMEPAIAATLAAPLLGERISFSFIIGTCLIVLGVYWGTLGKPEHHHLHHRAHRN